MKSEHGASFNHDEDAPDYDEDVQREEHPVRKGYQAVLSWVGSRVAPGSVVLDLGSGSGNTILALPVNCRVVAVDLSEKMTQLAEVKLDDRPVEFVLSDIVEYVDTAPLDRFDFVISTYALHHLTPEERRWLFARVREKTAPNAHIVIGDLMYEDDADRTRIKEKYRGVYPDLTEAFEEEFFWNLADTKGMLTDTGWDAEWKRFSDLSWVVELSVKPGR